MLADKPAGLEEKDLLAWLAIGPRTREGLLAAGFSEATLRQATDDGNASSEMTTRATCHGSPPTQKIFQFDAIMNVRVAAVRATQTSWRSRRPVWQERFNRRPCVRITHIRP